ncbi:hypothetical protein [Marinobacter sp.]|uniref:hypothetical protein n=1 Tax=Marinobacter sp. TaxID=50741 RepID=UPI00384F0590
MDPILGHVITGVVALVVGLALQRFADKPKLQYFIPGTFMFDVTDPKVTLQTDSLTLQNAGRKAATNIELVHKERPDHFQFSQAISYSEDQNPNGEYLIKIASLGPKEFLNIQYLSHIKPPVLRRVRSDQGPAQLIQVRFQPIYPKWLTVVVAVLMLSGFGLLLYWAIKMALLLGKLLAGS